MTFRAEPGSGWMRYRGSGKRGRQDLRTAVVDVKHAQAELAHARVALERALAAEDKAERDRLLDKGFDYVRRTLGRLRDASEGRKRKRKPASEAQLRLPRVK